MRLVTSPKDAAPVSPAAHQTLRILQFLAEQRGPVAASTIAGGLGLPRSTTYRLLGVLTEHGFAIYYREAQRFGIGLSAFEMSSGFTRQEPLTRLGRPILAALVDKVGQSAHLAVLHGRDVIYLVEERAPRRPPLVTGVGVRLPSQLTASGRAQLAALPDAQLRALFPTRSAFVERGEGGAVGPASLSELRALLATVRDAGFAAEDGNVTSGLASVAVAIRDRSGWPTAAIAVTFAREQIPDHKWADLARDVRGYAVELAHRIHGQPD